MAGGLPTFGGSFADAFGSTYGAIKSGRAQDAQIKLAQNQDARAQAEADRQAADFERKQQERNEMATAGTIYTGAGDDAFDVNPSAAKKAAPAAAIAGQPQLPPGVQLPPPAGSAQAPAPAADGEKPVNYVEAMVNGKRKWVPETSVKRLSGSELLRAQAETISRFDPVIGAQLANMSIDMEGKNLELASKKFQNDVLAAKAQMQLDPQHGLEMMASAINNTGSLQKHEFTRNPDGSITNRTFADTAGGRRVLGEVTIKPSMDALGRPIPAEQVLADNVFASTSPQAMQWHAENDARFAQQMLDKAHQKVMEGQGQQRINIDKQQLGIQAAVAHSQIAENNAQAAYRLSQANKPQIDWKSNGKDANGYPQRMDSSATYVQVRDPEFKEWVDPAYVGRHAEMADNAKKRGLELGYNPDGSVVYTRKVVTKKPRGQQEVHWVSSDDPDDPDLRVQVGPAQGLPGVINRTPNQSGAMMTNRTGLGPHN